MGGRNGITGRTVKEVPSSAVAPEYRAQRVRRTNLQAALIRKVPEGVIKLRKRLVELTDLGVEGARLVFEDGEVVVADLVIGGDGIRSVWLLPSQCFGADFFFVRWFGKASSPTILSSSLVSGSDSCNRSLINARHRTNDLASNHPQNPHQSHARDDFKHILVARPRRPFL